MSLDDSRLALFLMLGQGADKALSKRVDLVPSYPLLISDSFDLSEVVPDTVHSALRAAEAFKLFFVFERYLRDIIIDVLSQDPSVQWWEKLPTDVRTEVEALEAAEDTKTWMALGTRDKSSLMTYPQLLRVIDTCWKPHFIDVVRDKSLIQQARVLTHLRNAVAHMTPVPDEELGRIKQVMRDWFRMVAP
ncbi:Swt1 family HEPN domain-containing protein [Xanthomonas campestris]|uniref:Swt1 family HEPN domain-containing protein n=1 Tax=Xanthomonas campestris TaxID=339 RepID=UPI001290070A|nr:Swt1 family HEPN domain-containing protein [Xanthomonas campestris]